MSRFVLLILASVLGAQAAQAQKALLLFGGENHRTFLGCLNCAKLESSSVCNKLGEYGSKFQSESIWNKFGDFGSKFSLTSPWNKFSTEAPIIVDQAGNSYGYFSTNQFHRDRTRIPWLMDVLNSFTDSDDLDQTRDLMCGD